MRDIIEVEKTELPCSFDIVLGSEEFNLLFKYNEACDTFTCTLSKNDQILVFDEPLIYGIPLFCDIYDSTLFPCVDIVPFDESHTEENVTWDNFGEKVLLTIDDEGDE